MDHLYGVSRGYLLSVRKVDAKESEGSGFVIGVSVTFRYDGDFDRARVVRVADNARAMFVGMPGYALSSSPSMRNSNAPRTSMCHQRATTGSMSKAG